LEALVKTIGALVLLSCCALAQGKRAISRAEVGCGPQDVKYEVKSDGSQHPTPSPEDGKALIYVVADGDLTSIFGFDEKWEGAVKGGRAPGTGGISSCQSSPVNTMSARCCNPHTLYCPVLAFQGVALEFRCIH
jgi:hypothetical protein